MSSNKNIDDLFREKLSGKQFEFNQTAWNKMEQLILKQEKKRRTGWVLWSAGIAAAVILAVGFFFIGRNPTNNIIAEKTTLPTISDTIKNNIQKDTTLIPNSKKELTASTKPDKPKSTPTKNTDTKIAIEEQPVPSKNNNDTDPLKKQSDNLQAINTPPIDDYFMENDSLTEKLFWEELSGKEKRQIKKQLINDEKLALMEYKTTKLPIPQNENDLQTRSVSNNKLNLAKLVNFNIVGGINLSQGFLNNDLTRANPSIDPVLGLGASLVLNSVVSLDINALYHKRGGLSKEPLPEQYSAIGTTEVVNKLHYIDIPFYINYRFQNRHAICFGLQYSYLLGVNSEVSGNTTNNVLKKQDYFANYDVVGIVGYKYLVNERFNLGVRANIGLFDVTLGQPVGENTFDMNRQVRFLLEYKLLKY